jgi:hypothetical protein
VGGEPTQASPEDASVSLSQHGAAGPVPQVTSAWVIHDGADGATYEKEPAVPSVSRLGLTYLGLDVHKDTISVAILVPDRTDPRMRDYRTGLLPQVLAAKRASGKGCIARTLGSHRVASRPIRSQVIRVRWLRRRSALNQCRVTWCRNAFTASVLPGTA